MGVGGVGEVWLCHDKTYFNNPPPPRVISFQFPPVPPLNPAGPDWSPLGSHWKRCDSPSKKKEKSSSPLNPGGK